jgi:lantibiotic modifying enzyme
MEGTVYTGFAHGVAGIVYFLAEYAHRFAASEAQAGALRAAEWLLSKAQPGSRFRSLQWPMRDGESEVWRWWCHGGPGIALSFLKLFEHFGDKRFADATRSALLEHPIHTRHSNLSQCHGLSGLGDIYIEAARVLHDQEWTARAEQITQLLFGLARMSTDGGATWLVEHPFRPTGDLMVGNGGVALYLARFLAPRGVSIPLLL